MILSKSFLSAGVYSDLAKRYALLAFLYGLSTLIIPLATQYLVNSLALSSLMANSVAFLFILLVLLTLAQLLGFGQVILIEYIQREIFIREVKKWEGGVQKEKAHYMLEIQTLMKSFSQAYVHLVEFTLTILFGFMVIITFHPSYLLLVIYVAFVLVLLLRTWGHALHTSLNESNKKYHLVDLKAQEKKLTEGDLVNFLRARDEHFYYIKRAKILVSFSFVLSQIYLLGMGIYLIESGQLSVGQLVSAEIILTGVMASFGRLPKTLEALYDFETSKIKIEKALGGSHGS